MTLLIDEEINKTMVDKKENLELEIQSLRGNIRNTERELEMFYDVKKRQEHFLNLTKQQIDVKKAMHSIAMDEFEILEPSWAFMKNPKYNELRKELSSIEHEFEVTNLEGRVKEMEERILRINEQIESQEENLRASYSKIELKEQEMGVSSDE